jgi:raffinose/stachyose/melibiose transport system permease protein
MRTANVLMGKKNKLVSAAQIGLLSVLFLLYFFPFMFVVVNSFKSTKEFLTNPIAIPLKLEFSNYITAFEKMRYTYAFVNSLIITVLSVALIAICSAMTAHVFVRKKWKINTYMFFIMVASMIIPFQAIMIPLVKIYGSIGMLNSKWALIYMYIGFGAPLAVFIYHGFLKSIPLELEEAAMIDGCSKLQIFFKIVFPLLKPTTMTIVILDMLWIWNDFLLPSLVLINPINRTLPLSTFYFFGTYTVDYGLLMAGLMMTMIPVIVVYLFLQKHIIKGVMQGSIK